MKNFIVQINLSLLYYSITKKFYQSICWFVLTYNHQFLLSLWNIHYLCLRVEGEGSKQCFETSPPHPTLLCLYFFSNPLIDFSINFFKFTHDPHSFLASYPTPPFPSINNGHSLIFVKAPGQE